MTDEPPAPKGPPKTTMYALVPPGGGAVAIMQVVEGHDVNACVAEFALQHWQPAGVREILPEHLPPHREYRNAWRDMGTHIGHDMDHARALHRDKMRAARAPLLTAIDLDYVRADERGDTEGKKTAAAKKQALRDVTLTDLSAAADVAALAAIWPEILT